MYRSFNDFSILYPTGSDFLIGFRPFQGEFKIDLNTLSKILSGGVINTPNVLYVSVSGSDGFSGRGEFDPFRTIKRACQRAAQEPQTRFTIFVKTGDYFEATPIYVPPSTSLIGDNLRRTNVFPLPNHANQDMFWVTNADYVWGFTFRGHKGINPETGLAPAAFAFPNITYSPVSSAIAFDYKLGNTNLGGIGFTPNLPGRINDYSIPFNATPKFVERGTFGRPLNITTSPYIQGCSSITSSTTPGADNAGSGIRVDGALVGGFLRSMVTDSFTQFNEGGLGISIVNNGYAQLVSTFTIACTMGIMVSAGGSCDINTSNCSFGLTGLAAIGRSNTKVLTGGIAPASIGGAPTAYPADTTTITVTGIADPYLYGITVAERPCFGMVFSLDSAPSTFFVITSATKIYDTVSPPVTAYSLELEDFTGSVINVGEKISFFYRSQILASSITMEYVGSGTVLGRAVPTLGGASNAETLIRESDGGKVFVTLTDEKGDFKVGTDFTIRQATGTIEGRTFRRSIFSLITPFVLSLE